MTDKNRIEFETFRKPSSYEIIKETHPSCGNGSISIRKYRVIAEEIEEPVGVLQSRLLRLCEKHGGNHHNWGLLKSVARKLGMDSSMEALGLGIQGKVRD